MIATRDLPSSQSPLFSLLVYNIKKQESYHAFYSAPCHNEKFPASPCICGGTPYSQQKTRGARSLTMPPLPQVWGSLGSSFLSLPYPTRLCRCFSSACRSWSGLAGCAQSRNNAVVQPLCPAFHTVYFFSSIQPLSLIKTNMPTSCSAVRIASRTALDRGAKRHSRTYTPAQSSSKTISQTLPASRLGLRSAAACR